MTSILLEYKTLNQTLEEIQHFFIAKFPLIIIAIILLVIGYFAIKKLKKIAFDYIDKKSEDSLASDFLVNLIAFILTVILVIICLSILGWGHVTDRILAGAGITTFIIGFALKDIGENFLAGILMAFRRPFKVGDLIEIESVRGRVTEMSLRETIIKTSDGKEVFIPNAMLVKNLLVNHTYDNLLRSEFSISIENNEDTEKAIKVIEDILKGFEKVEKSPSPRVVIDEINSGSIIVRAQFWFKTENVNASASRLRSDIMLRVFKTLLQKGHNIASESIQLKSINEQNQ
ncbi:mechanosensitive ion channel family protein [Flavobacterium amniphilum]|uniref:mechanosensitive ion channel family protein n=1 Tax=Flavobacterium amniphilum TaxID=1834035 RepID=UPI00202A710E|nr:mechanosensitive ion channel family protein [Flavobacterium amniphilum]MCL9806259.1 mechanosensitive ion channel family protein [Flavobacterium amniphilum]